MEETIPTGPRSILLFIKLGWFGGAPEEVASENGCQCEPYPRENEYATSGVASTTASSTLSSDVWSEVESSP